MLDCAVSTNLDLFLCSEQIILHFFILFVVIFVLLRLLHCRYMCAEEARPPNRAGMSDSCVRP